eukprot:255151_1
MGHFQCVLWARFVSGIFVNGVALAMGLLWKTSSSCDTTQNPDSDEQSILSVTSYLIIAGIIFLLLSCCITYCHFNINKLQTQNRYKKWIIVLSAGFIGALNMIWACVGFALHEDLSEQCKNTHKGKFVLAWAILKIFFGFGEIFLAITTPMAKKGIYTIGAQTYSANDGDDEL